MRDNLPVTDLVTRARNGEKQAWDALVERYAPLIWSICRRYRLGDADAEDVGQAVWLRLVGHLDNLHDPAALPGWLATTTRRECWRVRRATCRPPAAGQVLDAETCRTSRPRRPSTSCSWPSAMPRCARRSPTCLRSASDCLPC